MKNFTDKQVLIGKMYINAIVTGKYKGKSVFPGIFKFVCPNMFF